MKIEKAGISFKSLENSSGSWREDKVRGMVGGRDRGRGRRRREKEGMKEGVGKTGWKYGEVSGKQKKKKEE